LTRGKYTSDTINIRMLPPQSQRRRQTMAISWRWRYTGLGTGSC